MTYRTFDGTSQVEAITNGRFSSDGTQYLKDSETINVGTSSDLKIFHDGSNSIINDAGTGSLLLQVGGSTKFETSATGTNVTGVHVDDGATHDGDVTFTGATANVTWDKSADDLIFADSAKAAFGTGGDLQLFHSGTNSLIDNNTGGLYIRNNVASDVGGDIYIQAKSGENSAIFTHDAGAALHYDNAKKFETTSAGVNISGRALIGTTTLAPYATRILTVGDTTTDDTALEIRSSDDTIGRLYFNDSASAGEGAYQGSVEFNHADNSLLLKIKGETSLKAVEDTQVELNYNGAKKFETTSVGVKVTGNYQAVDGYHIYLGTGNDLDIVHDATDSWIKNSTGYLYLDSGTSACRIISDSSWADGSMAAFYRNGAVELYYDNSKKIETTSNGVTVTGELQGTGDLHLNNGTNSGKDVKFVAASDIFRIYDDVKLTCGTGDDIQMYHDSSGGGNYIDSVNRSLIIRRTGTATETMAQFTVDGSVDLYHDGSKKIETTAWGVQITGDARPAADDSTDLGTTGARWDDVYATNGTIQTSDRNQKESITATDLGLAFVNKLTPVSFKRKGKTRTHYGLVAQDVETVITDLGKNTTQFAPLIKEDVSEKLDGSDIRYGLRYSELISPLIKAVQELSAKVTALENA